MTNENYQKLLSKLEKSFMSIEPFGSSGANGENNTYCTQDRNGDSLYYYTSRDGYLWINKLLNRVSCDYEDSSNFEKTVEAICNMSGSFEPLKTKRVVYRGTKDRHLTNILDMTFGDTIELKGFTSASDNSVIADFYARYMRAGIDGTNPIIFTIDMPRGFPCRNVCKSETNYNEWEMVFPPARYMIKDVRRKKSGELNVKLTPVELLDLKSLLLDGLEFVGDNVNRNIFRQCNITKELVNKLREKVERTKFPEFDFEPSGLGEM